MLRGVAAVDSAAANLAAARAWCAVRRGTPPYFERPGCVEFRIGPDEVAFGIVDAACAPAVAAAGSGAVLYWTLAGEAATLAPAGYRNSGSGAAHRVRAGIVTASVADPFGNLLGIMEAVLTDNVHFEAVHAAELAGADPMDDEETAV